MKITTPFLSGASILSGTKTAESSLGTNSGATQPPTSTRRRSFRQVSTLGQTSRVATLLGGLSSDGTMLDSFTILQRSSLMRSIRLASRSTVRMSKEPGRIRISEAISCRMMIFILACQFRLREVVLLSTWRRSTLSGVSHPPLTLCHVLEINVHSGLLLLHFIQPRYGSQAS